jgi:hypothetical protein
MTGFAKPQGSTPATAGIAMPTKYVTSRFEPFLSAVLKICRRSTLPSTASPLPPRPIGRPRKLRRGRGKPGLKPLSTAPDRLQSIATCATDRSRTALRRSVSRPRLHAPRWKMVSISAISRGLFEGATEPTSEREPLPNPGYHFPAEGTLPAGSGSQLPPDTGRREHRYQGLAELSQAIPSAMHWHSGPFAVSNVECPTNR